VAPGAGNAWPLTITAFFVILKGSFDPNEAVTRFSSAPPNSSSEYRAMSAAVISVSVNTRGGYFCQVRH
jgi:hypothetical protein